MKKACGIFSGAVILLSAWVIYMSFSLRKSIITYDIGPAMYPRLICYILAFLSVLLVAVECSSKKQDSNLKFLDLTNLAHIAIVFAFLAALQYVGFPICAFVIIGVMMKIMGCPKRWQIIAFSAVASTLVYIVFKMLLHVRLPLGVLKFIF